MTLDPQSAGTLAQIYAVGLLTLAVEVRFLRTWDRWIVQRVARWIVGIFVGISVTACAAATVALGQSVLFDEPVEGTLFELVRVSGFLLAAAVGAVLGGTVMTNVGLGTRSDQAEREQADRIALATAAALTKALNDRDEAKRARRLAKRSRRHERRSRR